MICLDFPMISSSILGQFGNTQGLHEEWFRHCRLGSSHWWQLRLHRAQSCGAVTQRCDHCGRSLVMAMTWPSNRCECHVENGYVEHYVALIANENDNT